MIIAECRKGDDYIQLINRRQFTKHTKVKEIVVSRIKGVTSYHEASTEILNFLYRKMYDRV